MNVFLSSNHEKKCLYYKRSWKTTRMKLTTTQSAHHLGTLFYQFRFTTIVVKEEVARRFCNEGGGLMAMVCTATSSSDLVLCAGTGSYRRAPAPRWGGDSAQELHTRRQSTGFGE